MRILPLAVLLLLAAPTAPAAGPAPLPTVTPSAAAADVPLAGAAFAMIHTPSAPDAFGGPRTGQEPTLSDHVADYRIAVTLDPVKHTLDGKETLRWRNRSTQPIGTLYFHTYLNAFSGHDSTFAREQAVYGGFRSGVDTKKGQWGSIEVTAVTIGALAARTSYVHPDGGPAGDRTVLRVDLPADVAPGATVELALAFHDQLPRVIARTGWFGSFHLVAQFFPKIGVLELPGERGATAVRWNCHELHMNSEFYADWGDYQLEVTAPPGFVVEGNGVRVGAPMVTTAGAVHTFKAADVHDAVFTAWDGYAPALHGSYDGAGSPHVEVQVLFPPEYRQSAEVALKATLDSLKYFSQQLGPYPYPHVTVVVPPYNAGEAGGMEYETFFTTDASALPEYVRYVTVHEFGHGYFMGLLASNEFEEPFLDEGLNELFDSRMVNLDPPHEPLPAERRLHVTFPKLDQFHLERISGVSSSQADAIAESSWHRFTEGSYGSVYARTAAVFHDLEAEIGTPAFEKAFRLYYSRWHFRHPSAGDLHQAFVDSGVDSAILERVFTQAVYGTGVVDDAVQSVTADEDEPQPGLVFENDKWIERTPDEVEKRIKDQREAFKKTHGDKPVKGPFGEIKASPFGWRNTITAFRRQMFVPQILLVTYEDGSSERIAWPGSVDEKWHRWQLPRPVRVHSAQLDPDGAILLDVNKFDDGMTRQPSHAASRRWTLDASAFVDALLAIGGSL